MCFEMYGYLDDLKLEFVTDVQIARKADLA